MWTFMTVGCGAHLAVFVGCVFAAKREHKVTAEAEGERDE